LSRAGRAASVALEIAGVVMGMMPFGGL
jgi:hypothetical protein